MNLYYITGSSSGIGLHLALELLKTPKNKVIGLGRSCTIKNKNYTHITIDFNNISEVQNFKFTNKEDYNKITLINNAGIIGQISQVGKLENNSIIENYNVNIIAPSILMNSFIKQYQNTNSDKTILNISSGAGRHSISSWATYCASKSALDMFSQTIFDEQQKIQKNLSIKIYSLAPGIVDTKMQDVIRDTKKIDFDHLEKFVNYKKQKLLSSPQEVALQTLIFLKNTKNYKNVIYDLREI